MLSKNFDCHSLHFSLLIRIINSSNLPNFYKKCLHYPFLKTCPFCSNFPNSLIFVWSNVHVFICDEVDKYNYRSLTIMYIQLQKNLTEFDNFTIVLGVDFAVFLDYQIKELINAPVEQLFADLVDKRNPVDFVTFILKNNVFRNICRLV